MPPTVLVIDDEAPVRSLLRLMLESEGYAVVDAPNGAWGLRVLEAQAIDLLITDLFMPEKEGMETIREALWLRPGLPILAISGGGRSGDLGFLPMAKNLGAMRTLAKPFERAELLAAVRALLGAQAPEPKRG